MLRITLALALVACGSSKTPPQKQEKLQAGDIAFVGATVVPMNTAGVLADHTVVVRGDRIVMVSPATTIDPTGATIVDVKGKWIVPGLADMHIHTWSEMDFALYLLNGVTTIRNMFGSPQHLTWREDIASGKLAGPTLITAGPIVDGDPPVWPGSAVVTSAEAARETVRKQKQAGYDFIKVYNGLSVESYDAIVAEAKAQQIPFAGHVPKAVGLDKALAAGQLTIEHLDGYLPFSGAPRVDPQVVAATAKAGTWNCPTLVVTERFSRMDKPESLEATKGLQYVMSAVREQWNPKNDFRLKSWTPEMFEQSRARNSTAAKLVGDLHKAGAKLVLGTDTGNPFVVPGFAVHDELALFVGAGLTPWEALRTATAASAEVVGQPGSFGVIAPGARADLVVVDRDPLRDIGALAEPAIVVVRGKRHDRKQLLSLIEQGKAPADPYAKLPALETEGTKLAEARYEIVQGETVIGRDRAVISKLDNGTRVVRGQAVWEMPAMVVQYRATANGVDYTDGLAVTREGTKVIAKTKDGKRMELATTADAVIAPQTVAEYVWYADKLAKTAVGASTTIQVAAVIVENEVRLDPATYTFKRIADIDKRRAYELTGKVGSIDVTGSFSVDADGAPHDMVATVKWGTFTTRRVK